MNLWDKKDENGKMYFYRNRKIIKKRKFLRKKVTTWFIKDSKKNMVNTRKNFKAVNTCQPCSEFYLMADDLMKRKEQYVSVFIMYSCIPRFVF